MDREYSHPTDFIHLRAWVASSSPYTSINHTQTPFPFVNDFTTPELEEVLRYGLETFARLKTQLALESASAYTESSVRKLPRSLRQTLTEASLLSSTAPA